MINKTFQIPLSYILAGLPVLVALFGTTAYATWEIRKDYIDDLKRQIETYEKSNSWKLPATLNALRQASDTFQLSASERKELAQLRVESAALRSLNQKLTVAHDDARKRLDSAQAELARLSVPVTTVRLLQGDSQFLIGNTVNLALIYPRSSGASIRLANRERSIDLGETIEFEARSKQKCELTLVKASVVDAHFVISCP